MAAVPSLVSTQWLEDNLQQRGLCILDATITQSAGDDGQPRIESGLLQFEQGHIPGAQFADLLVELSDCSSTLGFAFPPEQQFTEVMQRLGVSSQGTIVVYCQGYAGLATRLWWMLRAVGADNVAVLDGGLEKWKAEQRSIKSGPAASVAAGDFRATLNSRMVATRESVQLAIGEGKKSQCLIDSLPVEHFNGTAGNPFGYDRPGHITGAVNKPVQELINPETGEYRSLEELGVFFESVLSNNPEQIITYCGGGIAATQNAFALHLLGCDRVSVYDASLQEWAADDSLPMSCEI